MIPILAGPSVGLSAEYRCVLNEGTDREYSTGWFKNLITDGGLDRLATGLVCAQYGSIGTGNTAPANANTSLVAFVAQVNSGTNDGGSNLGPSTYVSTSQMHWAYAQGAVVGNMAEVGVGWGASGTNLFSRALILDGGGSPTTLTVAAIDQLTVYYRITVTPVTTDATGTVVMGGRTYNYTGRLSNAASWNANFVAVMVAPSSTWPRGYGSGGQGIQSYSTQTLGAIASTPAGTATNGAANATITFGSYTALQKYQDSTFTAAPAECNSAGGVGSALFNWGGGQMIWQYSFVDATGGTVIPKDNTKTMAFTIRFSWDRN